MEIRLLVTKDNIANLAAAVARRVGNFTLAGELSLEKLRVILDKIYQFAKDFDGYQAFDCQSMDPFDEFKILHVGPAMGMDIYLNSRWGYCDILNQDLFNILTVHRDCFDFVKAIKPDVWRNLVAEVYWYIKSYNRH
jgi:hypothetical protein